MEWQTQHVSPMDATNDRRLKLIIVCGLVSLIAAIGIVLIQPSANQYEISLYGALPWYFWLSLGVTMFAGAISIGLSIRTPTSAMWIGGAGLLLFSNLLLVSLPFIRGYYMFGRSDAMSHLGYTYSIEVLGSTSGNLYPPIHLLLLTISWIGNIDFLPIAMLIPVVFSVIYFGGMLAFIFTFFESRNRVLFAIPFVLLPVLRHAHLGLRPFDVSVMLIPLVLYIFVKTQRSSRFEYRLLLAFVLLGLLLYHALTGFFLVMIFGVYLLSRYLPAIDTQAATPTNVFSLAAGIFIIWYSSSTSIIRRFERIYNTFFGSDQTGETRADTYSSTIEQATPALADFARILLIRYGMEMMLFALAGLFIVLLGSMILTRRQYPDPIMGMLIGTVLLFGVGGLAFLFYDLIVPPERPFQIAKVAAVVLASQVGYLVWNELKIQQRGTLLSFSFHTTMAVILVVLVTLSLFSIYESPLGSERNNQVTEMEVHGSQWIHQHGNHMDTISEFHISYWRFHQAQHGTHSDPTFYGTDPPDRFNYHEVEQYGQTYETDRYLTITELGRIVYPNTFAGYEERWRYTPEDFARLENDRSIDRVYDNGDYTQYLVTGGGR